jgi:hypothetical protein
VRAAVVVGCDGYGSPNASLAGAVRDALAFWRWVCDPNGGGVTEEGARRLLLSPSQKGVAIPADVAARPADKASFEIALHELVREAGEARERLYVYFAGHGFSVDEDFSVQNAIAFADFDRDRTDNSIVVSDLLSELSFTGFAEQILVFDACRNIPFEGRLRAGRISRPFDRAAGPTEQFCALATTALNRTSDGAAAGSEEASFSGCLMHALAGDGAAKVWNEESNEYVVRWDQMFEFVTAALRASVGDDRLPRQLGERDIGDPVLARLPADGFPDVTLELRVHPDEVAGARVVVLDPPEEHPVVWTAPGPASIALVPRDYIVVASAEGFEPERRRWRVPAYADVAIDITFVAAHRSRGVDAATPAEPSELAVRAPDSALAVSVSLSDGSRVEGLGVVVPALVQSTTLVARATAPDGRDGPVRRRRVVPEDRDELLVMAPPVDDAMRRFAERLELEAGADGLVDVGGATPAWPAPSSLLAMAWARPGFVPTRVLPQLPDARTEAVVVIVPDGNVVVHAPEKLLVVDPALQPFGRLGARRVDVDDRQLLLPNIPDRALIVDLTGSTPFAVPAPVTKVREVARRVDLGHRYAAFGRLRPGLQLLTAAGEEDEIARTLASLLAERLDGRTVPAGAGQDAVALPPLALAVRSVDPLLERWAIAPRTSITVASARDA